MNMHPVRLDLRACYVVERRLSEHLKEIGTRRGARNLRVRELLELGLTAQPTLDQLDGSDGPVDRISVDLKTDGDRAVLGALAALPKRLRAAHLRQWLLAGFVASEIPSGAKPPSSRTPAAPPPAMPTPATPTMPTPVPATTAEFIERTETSLPLDFDLSQAEAEPPKLRSDLRGLLG